MDLCNDDTVEVLYVCVLAEVWRGGIPWQRRELPLPPISLYQRPLILGSLKQIVDPFLRKKPGGW